jgi:hypothetical protein
MRTANGLGGKFHCYRGPCTLRVIRGTDFGSVDVDDGAADRQTEPGAVGLGSHERFKEGFLRAMWSHAPRIAL